MVIAAATETDVDLGAASAYEELGVCALGRLLDDQELEAVRDSVAEIAPLHGAEGPYACIVHDAWRHSTVLAGLLPRIGARACAALGVPELRLFHDHILVKAPGGENMDWHQDYSYLPLDRSGGTTLWIALDDVTVENGCLYYALGSHRRGELRAAWGLRGDDDPRCQLPPIALGTRHAGVPVPTLAGHGLVHHELVLHHSPSNRSPRPRRSWALSLVLPEARWDPNHSPHPRSSLSPRQTGDPLEDDLPRLRLPLPRGQGCPGESL